jgi:predicted  nucleic acid-binding Zn-ribbon protein
VTGFPAAAQRRLLDLQAADSRLDLLDQRWRGHPALAALDELDRREAELVSEEAVHAGAADLARSAVRTSEREAEQVRAHQQRDQKRLDAGSVSSPRELEGLQHEIATLQVKLEAIEDTELEAMEQLEQAEGLLAAVAASRVELAGQREQQLRELDEARAAIDAERVGLRVDREALLGELPAALLERYERSRARHGGVGVAALRHGRCEGCRLNLTPAALGEARAAPEDALLTCEECGRLLVRVEEA